jgi:hypothetical protein
MAFTQCFKITLRIPSYPNDFFVFKEVIVFITSVSVIQIHFISLIPSMSIFTRRLIALFKSVCLLFTFSAALMQNY